MHKPTFLRVLCGAILLIAASAGPESALAHSGHGGGGGGYHGGGGGYHGGGGGGYHGGGYYGGHGGYYGGHGGYYGGGYHGWHGGYYGGRGGYWGYPGYGYGWGISVRFGWGSYWPYAYPYGYGSVWVDPYYYPDYYPYYYVVPSYTVVYNRSSSNYSQPSSPAVQPPAPTRGSAPNPNSVTIKNAAYAPTTPERISGGATGTASSYRPASSPAHQLSMPRPEVQNVIRALRAMPPAARQRQIESGRYSNLSPQELELVKYAADIPLAVE